MENYWSENIQGPLTLYASRRVRFDDRFKRAYTGRFGLDENAPLRMLEIGCGPGALAGALRRWYPRAAVTGVDRDENFIAFAARHVPGVTFVQGDATRLPFDDSSFDVTISYTVSEHIPPAPFYAEQRRVLAAGGVCLVLSCRKTFQCPADCLAETEAERRFWAAVGEDEAFQTYGVGRYAMTEQQLPQAMEQSGFSEVSADYLAIPLTPDCTGDAAFSEDILNAERLCALEAIDSAHREGAEADAARAAANAKFDRRLTLLRQGVHQWDTFTTVTMILRGVNKKP